LVWGFFFIQNNYFTGDNLMDGELQPIVINLDEMKQNKLNESFLVMFGTAIKAILSRMFGGPSIPVSVKGSKSDIAAFAAALAGERAYMQSFLNNGLDNPNTYRNKWKLDSAVAKFERKTGLKWPFK
jgi:hypothetical protein